MRILSARERRMAAYPNPELHFTVGDYTRGTTIILFLAIAAFYRRLTQWLRYSSIGYAVPLPSLTNVSSSRRRNRVGKKRGKLASTSRLPVL